jgi:hypothetical protein
LSNAVETTLRTKRDFFCTAASDPGPVGTPLGVNMGERLSRTIHSPGIGSANSGGKRRDVIEDGGCVRGSIVSTSLA